jgi:hypothetical protein
MIRHQDALAMFFPERLPFWIYSRGECLSWLIPHLCSYWLGTWRQHCNAKIIGEAKKLIFCWTLPINYELCGRLISGRLAKAKLAYL